MSDNTQQTKVNQGALRITLVKKPSGDVKRIPLGKAHHNYAISRLFFLLLEKLGGNFRHNCQFVFF
jgi:hypothetical protein